MLRDYWRPAAGLDAEVRQGHNHGMSDAPSPRSGRSGGIITAVIVGGSFIAVIGWYLMQNRGGATAIDASGFDLSAAPTIQRAVPVAASAPSPAAPASSLGMLKADAGISIVESNSQNAAPGAAAQAAKSGDKKEQAHMGFTEACRRHEGEIRAWATRMTNKYPIVRAYGKEWMSHPDLKKLNDDYMRTKDPIAFMVGLSRAPSLGAMMKKYGAAPEMREVVMQGMKQAPGDVTSSAMEVLQNDHVVKDLVANVASGLGLPPSVTAMINGPGAGDPSKLDQSKVMGDIMNNPEMKKAMQQQGGQAPPVNLSNLQNQR
jgi:hypothetical protein